MLKVECKQTLVKELILILLLTLVLTTMIVGFIILNQYQGGMCISGS